MTVIKIGEKFGRWTVVSKPIYKIEFCNNIKYRRAYYRVKCSCGNIKKLISHSFQFGNSKSCGCLNKEIASKRFTTHGMRQTRFYKIYSGIVYRCGNSKFKNYKNIKCLWRTFEEFKRDMYINYLKYEKKYGAYNTTIDRINTKGNYCKENCRWLNIIGQNRNRRNNYIIKHKNQSKTLQEWSNIYNIKSHTLRYRLKANWPTVMAMKTPVSSSNRFIKLIKK